MEVVPGTSLKARPATPPLQMMQTPLQMMSPQSIQMLAWVHLAAMVACLRSDTSSPSHVLEFVCGVFLSDDWLVIL